MSSTARASRPARRRRSWPPASTSSSKGLYAQKRISRTDERGYHGAEPAAPAAAGRGRAAGYLAPDDDDEAEERGGGRKKRKQYN